MKAWRGITTAAAILMAWAGIVTAQPVVSVTLGEQMRIDVADTTVTPITGGWELTCPMETDNDGAFGVSTSFRRWWHFEVSNLNPAGETLRFNITLARYSDTITPVVSFDGGPYTRIASPPTRSGSTDYIWTFDVDVPPGTTSLRVAKYFPYTLADREAFRTWYNDAQYAERVEEEVIGYSVQSRPIYMLTLTDESVPDAGKKRVWIHTCVHPSENTAYFTMEGIVQFLLSGSAYSEAILDNTIFNIVTMANPDGVALGNYRTTATSTNIENEFGAPYDSTVPEAQAIRLKIEEFMGTADNVGSNPIELLLNLHATHSYSPPFHFVHNGTWSQPGDSGAKPSVNALELQWVNLVKARSPLVALGNSQSSTFNHPSRPYVESMMHDRYSINPQWNDVMAITFEGTYQYGPISGVPNVPDDYRDVGAAMGGAIGDFFGIAEPAGLDSWVLY
ncbi:MAG: hypothetical protein PWP23_1921 [Candidatus Sumerlaeota bacterium]|nr:hypothetical protein [Candidatus Sumerlaeota bacterium]